MNIHEERIEEIFNEMNEECCPVVTKSELAVVTELADDPITVAEGFLPDTYELSWA